MEQYSYTSLNELNERSEEASPAPVVSTLVKERRFRWMNALEDALVAFTPGERLFLYILSIVLGLSTLALVADVNAMYSVAVPAEGGSLIEGEVGPARFINPLLALSGPDQDLTALVYSGLTRDLPDGTIVPDLASSYDISSDGRTYTFHLRQNATFQDGTKVTAGDVLYTIEQAQNPNINSIHRADWEGVVASSPDPETIVLTLPHAYAPFINDTTLGILPKHLWQNVSDEEFPFSPLNTHPIGSGPFKVRSVSLDPTGAAARYDLSPFQRFTLGTPYLGGISFVFFANEDSLLKALAAGQINAVAGIDAPQLRSISSSDLSALIAPLPRDFGVFLNQSHNPVLADASVRKALDAATDKDELVSVALGGLGAPMNGPIPPGFASSTGPIFARPLSIAEEHTASSSLVLSVSAAQQARTILQQGGWTFDQTSGSWTKKKQTLSFTIATADQPELVATGNALVTMWKAAGIQATLQVYPLAELNTNVIRPRNYDALLFGEAVGPQLDLYAFWHSSQRSDPGLNLANYANLKTDALLSVARATTDPAARLALDETIATDIENDSPAVFLYAPDFVYVVPSDLAGIELGTMEQPSDRFADVYRWYRQTHRVWTIFAPKTY